MSGRKHWRRLSQWQLVFTKKRQEQKFIALLTPPATTTTLGCGCETSRGGRNGWTSWSRRRAFADLDGVLAPVAAGRAHWGSGARRPVLNLKDRPTGFGGNFWVSKLCFYKHFFNISISFRGRINHSESHFLNHCIVSCIILPSFGQTLTYALHCGARFGMPTGSDPP